MATQNQQIGSSRKVKWLQRISMQIETLTKILSTK